MLLSPVDSNNVVRNKYVAIKKIGEGTYASVFLAKNKETNEKVAIKKIKIANSADGMDMSAIREIKMLRELQHPNVIRLVDCFSSGNVAPSLNMALEFLDTDLERLIKDRDLVFTPADIKGWMGMLCRGIEYCHRHFILHRDLKPNNLLIAPTGELKIADFGMARELAEPGLRMTSLVITLWYRPPELLFGAKQYSTAVDMWSVGCILAELLLRIPFLPGQSDVEQVTTIFRALGTPSDKDWPGHKALPNYLALEQFPRPPLNRTFPAAAQDTLDIVAKLLLYDPMRRLSAHDALHHPYFANAPIPTHYSKLPRHASKGADAQASTSHPLLSNSDVKDKNRTAADSEAGKANAANLTATAAPTALRKRVLGEVSPGTIAERKRIARKLAFG